MFWSDSLKTDEKPANGAKVGYTAQYLYIITW